ncbi:MAG TPA: hypothetical protein VLM40_13080 [Gemmata sp.]|nr:hypothetical protein [Gemmata sp.]
MNWPSCLLSGLPCAVKPAQARLSTGDGRGQTPSCNGRTRHPVQPYRVAAQAKPVVGGTRRDVSTAETITWIKEVAERAEEGVKTPALVVYDVQPERRNPLGTGLRFITYNGDRIVRTAKSLTEGSCGPTKHILRCW